MPQYEFVCEQCKKPFELTMTISEREKIQLRCPACKSGKITPQLASFSARTSRKS